MRSKFIACVVASAVLVQACSSDPAKKNANGKAEHVELLVFGTPQEIEAYRTLIKAYETAQHDVRVKLTEAGDRVDMLARLATSFAAGNPPDLFLLNYRSYGQFAAKGALAPIEDRLVSSKTFAEEDFFPAALGVFRFDNKLTCMPQNASSLVVYYNKALLQAAGTSEPQAGWTWDDMITKAKTLTNANGEHHGLGIEASIIRLAPFVWSNGGELVDDGKRPTRFTLERPKALEALQDFLDVYGVHHVAPSAEQEAAEDLETRFASGRLAMLLSSRRATTTFRESITDFDWDIAPLPIHKKPAGILHSDAYCLAAASKHQDAAWSFTEFALGPEGAPIIAATGRTVPSLQSVANSPAFLDPSAKPARSQIFLDSIPIIRALPTISTWPEIEDSVNAILEKALYTEGADARDVARAIDDATCAMFARAEVG